MSEIEARLESSVASLRSELESLGFDPRQVDEKIQQVQQSIAACIESHIAECQAETHAMEQQLQIELSNYNRICRVLGVDSVLELDSKGGLVQKVEFVREEFKHLHANYREKYDRLETLSRLYKEICNVLGDGTSDAYDNIGKDLSEERFCKIKREISEAQDLLKMRKIQVFELVKELIGLFAILEFNEYHFQSDPFYQSIWDFAIASGISSKDGDIAEDYDLESNRLDSFASSASINTMVSKKQILQEECSQRRLKLKTLGDQIKGLWEQLQVPLKEREKFYADHVGLGDSTILMCQSELNRLIKLKTEKLAEIIQRSLKKLEDVCDLCRFSHYEKRSLTSKFKFNPVCEETNELILAEIAIMETRYTELSPIFQLLEQRKKLLEEEAEYQRHLNDPDRFKKRFFLLQEEKLRRNVQKLPKLSEKILQLTLKYEQDYSTTLVLNNKRIIEEMNDYVGNLENQKQSVKPSTKSLPRTSSTSIPKTSSEASSSSSYGTAKHIGIPSTPLKSSSRIPTTNRR